MTSRILEKPKRSGFQMENGIVRMALIWFSNALDDGTALSAARFEEFLRALMCRSREHGAPLQAAAAKAIARYQADGRMGQWIADDAGADFVRQLCFDVLTDGKRKVAYWGDKYPEHLFYAEDLHKVFPNAKWLFVWREPGAVIEGLSRKLSSSVKRPVSDWRFCIEDCATQWVRWNRKWLEMRDEIPAHRRMQLSFDEFVVDPPGGLRRLSGFLEYDLESDKQTVAATARLRPSELKKWLSSPAAEEIAAQLDRADVKEVRQRLKQ